MTPEQLQLAGIVLNGLVVPALYGVVRLLWSIDRRLLHVEIKVGIATKAEN